MIKRSLIWLYSATTYLLWASTILLATVVLALRYLVLPHVHDYKDVIAQKVSVLAGQKITIGRIHAGWLGLQPRLDLYDVDLYDDQNRPALTLGHVETTLSWLSLPLAEPRLSELIVHQPKLTIRRDADGVIYVAGISMNGPSRPTFPNWLLRQSRVDIVDASVQWQDELRKAPPLALEKLNMTLLNPAWESLLGRHRFGLRATPSVGASSPLDIRGNLTGDDVSKPAQWSGKLYGSVADIDIAAWNPWLDYPFNMRQGRGATQVWLDFDDGKTQHIHADVQLRDVVTRFDRASPETLFRILSGRLDWEEHAQGYDIQADQLRLVSGDGLNLKNGRVTLRTRQINGKPATDGSTEMDEVNLEQLAAFSRGFLPLDAEQQRMLAEIAPKGQLQKLNLEWKSDASGLKNFGIRAGFSQLAMNPYRSIPGFAGLNGRVDATQDSGNLSLDAANTQIDFKNVLRGPIPVGKLSGQVNWKRHDQQIEVKVSNLAVVNPHISGTLSATYQYPGHGSGALDLSGKFAHANAKFASLYYPRVLSKDTLHWLDTSILAGHGEDINLTVKGNIDEFPWPDSKRGLFKITARVTDGLLDYADGWPKLEGLGVDLLFQGNRMELNANQGHFFGSRLLKAKAVIPQLDAAHPVLDLTSEFDSPISELVKYINHSPIRSEMDGFTDNLQAKGDGKLAIALNVPLDTDGEGTKFKGSYQMINGMLAGKEALPTMEAINGRLDFSDTALSAQNLVMTVFGGPAKISLDSRQKGQLHVTARAHLGEGNLRQFGLPSALMSRLRGATDWDADINIHQGLADLSVKSNLVGMAMNFPEPFNKAADIPLQLTIDKKAANAQQETWAISYGNVANANFLYKAQGGQMLPERGEIGFGIKAELPNKPGIGIKGTLPHADMDEWLALENELDHKKTGGKMDIAVNSVKVSINTLDLFQRRISALKINASAIPGGWKSALQSDVINGDVQLYENGNNDKIVARLKSFTVPPMAPAELKAPRESPRNPTRYPAMDLVVDEFNTADKKFGKLELVANQSGEDWNVEKLVISNPDSVLNMDGKLRNWKSATPATSFNLNWIISDIGKTMSRYGKPDAIKGGKGSLTGQLSWPGHIADYDPAILDGNLTLAAEKGQILKMQPGVGRLLSILSLQNLPRRLTFDFQDVFSAGFTFDKIDSSLHANKGNVRIDKFHMEGPAAKVDIKGETNLVKETQNLHVKVTPAITGSLSLAAFAGGPAVGAAAWIAQKLLRDPADKLAAYEFDIVGTWQDPQEVSAKKTGATPADNTSGPSSIMGN